VTRRALATWPTTSCTSAAVDQTSALGYDLVGGIGEYEGVWRMAYVRSPEGIIVFLADRIG
jgi:hypothetical protein